MHFLKLLVCPCSLFLLVCILIENTCRNHSALKLRVLLHKAHAYFHRDLDMDQNHADSENNLSQQNISPMVCSTLAMLWDERETYKSPDEWSSLSLLSSAQSPNSLISDDQTTNYKVYSPPTLISSSTLYVCRRGAEEERAITAVERMGGPASEMRATNRETDRSKFRL